MIKKIHIQLLPLIACGLVSVYAAGSPQATFAVTKKSFDFIVGVDGDIFFNQCLIYTNKNSTITAPATSTLWGYVFMNCTIDGSVNTYKLGRSWNNSPRCVFINTTMKKLPAAAGWGDPMNVVPALFAEYNSMTASGSPVDLSGRRTTYTKDATTVTLNPVLTADQAAKYTVENVMKGSDNWRPADLTRQLSAPVVRVEGTSLKWNGDDNALCWLIFKDGKYYKCVTTDSCGIASGTQAKYTVRAANAMGGLGARSNTVTVGENTGNERTGPAGRNAVIRLHCPKNKIISVPLPSNTLRASLDIVSTAGRMLRSLPLEKAHNDLHLDNFAAGTYIVRIAITESGDTKIRICVARRVVLW